MAYDGLKCNNDKGTYVSLCLTRYCSDTEVVFMLPTPETNKHCEECLEALTQKHRYSMEGDTLLPLGLWDIWEGEEGHGNLLSMYA